MTIFTVFCSLTAAICSPNPESTDSVATSINMTNSETNETESINMTNSETNETESINMTNSETNETISDEGSGESKTNPSAYGKALIFIIV